MYAWIQFQNGSEYLWCYGSDNDENMIDSDFNDSFIIDKYRTM